MPVRPCPACGHPAPRFIPSVSQDAHVNYYRCDGCAHVFTVRKDQPDGPHGDVTLRKP